MSKTVHIQSMSQFSALLSSSTVVVADFYADWCGPCQRIAPIYEQLSAQLSRPNRITFTKINTDQQQDLAKSHNIHSLPTFIVFRNGQQVEFIEGANDRKLSTIVKQLATEAAMGEGADAGGTSSGGGPLWLGAEIPRGYQDVTSSIDVLGLELLNWDSDHGNARTLVKSEKPKGDAGPKEDFVASDTDEQLMIYIPFQSTLKIHSIHITSNPQDTSDDESPSRPKLLKFYTNRPNILGFDEADDAPAAQEITLSEKDWNEKTGTAKVDLRLVKFTNVSSLVVFVVESEGDNEKVRIDRLRIIGETGEKRDGKIEKIASDD